MLGTLKTILIQGIAHDETSLDPHLNAYQDMLRSLKLTLRYTRFSTNATVAPLGLFYFYKYPERERERGGEREKIFSLPHVHFPGSVN